MSESENKKLKKELESNRELIDTLVRETIVLKETLKVKESIRVEQKEKNDSNNIQYSDEADIPEGLLKCNECEFTTRVHKYLKGHKVKHTGQYMCQQGCRKVFKTLSEVDLHVENAHKKSNAELVYKCKNCG